MKLLIALNALEKRELIELVLWLYRRVEGIVTEEELMNKIGEILRR